MDRLPEIAEIIGNEKFRLRACSDRTFLISEKSKAPCVSNGHDLSGRELSSGATGIEQRSNASVAAKTGIL